MKYHSTAVFICALILIVCVIFPGLLLVAIPILIGGAVKTSMDKKEQVFCSKANYYLSCLDTMSFEEFKRETTDLITKANFNNYPMEHRIEESTVKYYQTIDNIGIAIIRKDFGNQVSQRSIVVTNRQLTPKAREFCENGFIKLVDRNVLFDMYVFILKKEGKGV